MADGTPEAPISATRVAAAAEPSAAAPGPAVAAVEPVAAAAPAVAEPIAAAAAAAPEPKTEPELVTERPSLLETFGKDDKPKPVSDKPEAEAVKAEATTDKPKDGDVKPAEAKPAEKPVEAAKPETEPKPGEAAKPDPLAPVEYQYELPPTLKMDEAVKADLHTAFDAFRADPAKGAQGLIDLHNKVLTDLRALDAAETLRNQHKAFNDTRTGWNTQWLSDPQIGGAGHVTAMRAIARMRDQFVSSEKPGTPEYTADMKQFEDFLRITGAGDHPAFGRFLHNVAQAFDEPALPPSNPKPPPNNGRAPGSRRDAMYTHPSSQKTS